MLRGVPLTLTGKSGEPPIVVIDGISAAAHDVSVDDNIESIDILKDGSAAAIYVRAATSNGVTDHDQERSRSRQISQSDYHRYASGGDHLQPDRHLLYRTNNAPAGRPPDSSSRPRLWALRPTGGRTRCSTAFPAHAPLPRRQKAATPSSSVCCRHRSCDGIIRNTGQERINLSNSAGFNRSFSNHVR